MATKWTEATASLSNSASTLFAANPGRRGLVIGNPTDTLMTVRFSGAASGTVGIPIPAGTALEYRDPRLVPDGAVSVFCSGTSKAVTAYEC